ncbi:MAG: hypothetical protein KDA84_09050 [Planctomycetaceae bacterium]|nr:hypothetical protein [Planctomycetaceae bacterium]
MKKHGYQVGDWVIYRKSKQSPVPGPRAQQVTPSKRGEVYSYVVDKFWIVVEVLENHQIRLRTRRGKEHKIPMNDPNLRATRFWERWVYRSRFEEVAQSLGSLEAHSS